MAKKGLALNMPGVVDDVDAMLAEKASSSASVTAKKEKEKTAPVEPKKRRKTPVKQTVDDFDAVFKPKEEKELRNVAVNLRVKKSTKENLDLICKRLGRSQSDMVEFWVDLTMKKLTVKFKD